MIIFADDFSRLTSWDFWNARKGKEKE